MQMEMIQKPKLTGIDWGEDQEDNVFPSSLRDQTDNKKISSRAVYDFIWGCSSINSRLTLLPKLYQYIK